MSSRAGLVLLASLGFLAFLHRISRGVAEPGRQAKSQLTRRSVLAAASAQEALAANVSGIYKGRWRWRSKPNAVPPGSLDQGSGVVVVQLRATRGAHGEAGTVDGVVVLRDGIDATAPMVVLRLSGVYVAELGTLVGLARERGDKLLAHGSSLIGDAAYSAALREAGHLLRQLPAGGEGVPARKVAQAEDDARAALDKAKALGEACRFVVRLRLAPAVHTTGTAEDLSGGGGGMPRGAGAARAEAGGMAGAAVSGTIASEACGISLDLDVADAGSERYRAKAVRYAALVILVAPLQALLTILQMDAASTAASAARVSIVCIGQQAVIDGFLCLLHLTLAIMVEPLFNSLATASFTEFCLFGVVEMRLLMVVWRARRAAAADPWSLQRDISALSAFFYGALAWLLLLVYSLRSHLAWMLLLAHTFWLPQIVLCAKRDLPQPLRRSYVVGTSLLRLMIPLYCYGCPDNLLRVQPRPGLCAALVALVVAQAAILLLQRAFGPRCFIPRRFLPSKYDYARPLPPRAGAAAAAGPKDIETGDAGREECVICMNEICANEQHMVTPCDHCFHRGCLERWMGVKLECPTCRRQLPLP